MNKITSLSLLLVLICTGFRFVSNDLLSEVPREMNSEEKKIMQKLFPKMNVDKVRVTGEADPKYNCIAWTLGYTDRNIPTPPASAGTQKEMDAIYAKYGYKPSNKGTIAVMGLSREEIAHTCIFHGPTGRWESKLGVGLRVIHDLEDLKVGYEGRFGVVLYYYAKD